MTDSEKFTIRMLILKYAQTVREAAFRDAGFTEEKIQSLMSSNHPVPDEHPCAIAFEKIVTKLGLNYREESC